MGQSDWKVISSAGGHYPGADPAFFKDQNRVAVVTSLAIKIYQLSTKQVVAKIPFAGQDIVQLFLGADEKDFYVVRANGSVAKVGVQETSHSDLDLPGQVFRILEANDDNFLVVASTNRGLSLARFSETGSDTLFQLEGADTYAHSASCEYFVLAQRRAHETRLETFHLPSKTTTKIRRDRPAYSVAVSNRGLVAVGSTTGVIDVYYSKGIRALKWHMEEVQALTFSLDDNYLISGGKERVLVFWQLETDRQQFLPRLDGDITSIYTNVGSTLYGITLSGKQLVILSAIDLVSRLQVSGTKAYCDKSPERELRKLKKSQQPGFLFADLTTNLSIHPKTKNLYLFSGMASGDNSGPGSQVQIFNATRDEQESVLSLAPFIQPGKVRKEQRLPDPNILHLEFTASGSHMITVDTKLSPATDSLMSRHDVTVNLRFWRWEESWVLSTRVASPHGNGKEIVELRPSMHDETVLTAGADGSVRSWRPDLKTGTWSVRRILPGFNCTFKSVKLAWSTDGSVIALALNTNIYLIGAKDFKVTQVLPSVVGTAVRGMEFSGSHLVILSKSSLTVWDLVASQQLWSARVQMPANGHRLISIEHHTQRFAVAVNYWDENYDLKAKVLIFSLASPFPESVIAHETAVSALHYVPGSPSFYFIDYRGLVNTISSGVPTEVEKPSFQTSLATLYAEAQADDDLVLTEAVEHQIDVNSFDKVFDGDSTNLNVLFDRVMTLIAPPR